MIDPKVILKIAGHCGVEVGSLGRFDLSEIGIDNEALHPTVNSYFNHVPDTPIRAKAFSSRDLCRLCGRTDLAEHNEDYIPGCHILSSGFLSFGSEMSGDAFAVNIFDGRVFLVSHEILWDDEIYGDEDRANDNRQIIAEQSELIADSIPEFLHMWLARLEEVSAEERKFQFAAAKNPNAIDGDGNTQLILSVRSGNKIDVQKQIFAGVDIEYFGTTEYRNAIGESVVFGFPEILRILIDEEPVDPNDPFGFQHVDDACAFYTFGMLYLAQLSNDWQASERYATQFVIDIHDGVYPAKQTAAPFLLEHDPKGFPTLYREWDDLFGELNNPTNHADTQTVIDGLRLATIQMPENKRIGCSIIEVVFERSPTWSRPLPAPLLDGPFSADWSPTFRQSARGQL